MRIRCSIIIEVAALLYHMSAQRATVHGDTYGHHNGNIPGFCAGATHAQQCLAIPPPAPPILCRKVSCQGKRAMTRGYGRPPRRMRRSVNVPHIN